jgi:single-strand DNA-binding protein
MLNKVQIIGNLGSDPEVREAGSSVVANFKVAVNEIWKDKNGEKQTTTEWIPVVAWRQLAEICEKYIRKGQMVYVEGKWKTRSYEKDGVKHYTTELLADTIKMLGGNREQADPGQSREQAQREPAPAAHTYKPEEYTNVPEGEQSDLPF